MKPQQLSCKPVKHTSPKTSKTIFLPIEEKLGKSLATSFKNSTSFL